jgi:predicted phage tail protein
MQRRVFIKDQPRARVGMVTTAHAVIWGCALTLEPARELILQNLGAAVLIAGIAQGLLMLSAVALAEMKRRSHNSLANKNFGHVTPYLL